MGVGRTQPEEVLTSDQGKALCGETCVVETRTRSKPTDASETWQKAEAAPLALFSGQPEATSKKRGALFPIAVEGRLLLSWLSFGEVVLQLFA